MNAKRHPQDPKRDPKPVWPIAECFDRTLLSKEKKVTEVFISVWLENSDSGLQGLLQLELEEYKTRK